MRHRVDKAGTRRRRIRFFAVLLFLALFLFSAWKLAGILLAYHAGDVVQTEMMVYKPETVQKTAAPAAGGAGIELPAETDAEGVPTVALIPLEQENPSVQELEARYPDACGWLTIDGTAVDYPFARGEDNNEYLHASLEGGELLSGTIFLDYRCARDLSGVNSILYGHKMKNGTMFSDLTKFANTKFFEEHAAGTVFQAHATIPIEIVAYLLVEDSDPVLYDPGVDSETYLDYVRSHAKQFRETAAGGAYLTLSTCSYEFENARAVVVARLVR